MGINIALDGPSGAGKSTIAKAVAKKLGYIYIDTGALYRSIALFAINKGVDTKSAEDVVSLLPEIKVELKHIRGAQHIILNGEDVSNKIRTPEVSMCSSEVSAIPTVREFLFNLQRDIANKNNIIMDGRDIGTVVLPKADVKIFLTASAEERAKRRYAELIEKGTEITYEEVLKDINDRDYNDMHREIAPLKQADDAILIDTSVLTLEQSIEKIYLTINENINNTSIKIKKKKVNPVKMFFYQILRPLVSLVYHIRFNLKFEGKENIPKDGGYIFASNHRCYEDPVLISFPARVPFAYMAKEELFKKNFAFTALIKAFGAFPVVRGSGDFSVIDESIKRLNKGYNLVIFPEGTRSKDGKVGKGKTGVALIAAKAQVPVIPVGISFKGSKLKFRSKLIVRFGKQISPEELKITSEAPSELKVLKLKIMESITELVETDVNKL